MRDGLSHFYLRNISSGIFGGDRYDVRLGALPGARAVVRSTSATKVHAMPDRAACSRATLHAASGAILVYADGPLILQSDADLRQRVELSCDAGGIVAYAEILVMGRLASGEVVRFRRFDIEIVVQAAHTEVSYVERSSLAPETQRSSIMDASRTVVGTLVVAGVVPPPERFWQRLELDGDEYRAGYDTLPTGAGVVLRAVGSTLEPISRLLDAAVASVTSLTAAGQTE